ncbi:putative reverse transcriptase domain-containing protein [Tanacetum coccineum]|uniref:Reverse transcriptase domain-containing protein n=1 Tax=Tanacetum coccineum TaxID=301880 RepID=A0ABQ5F0K1_9ASTR
MDSITKLPRSKNGHDMIWVIVDRLTKLAHFLAIREDYSMERLARIYIDEIVARHRVPVSIILDRDGRFTSRCWPTIQKASGTSWDVHLPLAEFSYNNSYHSSIRCAPFEALYGRKCRSLVLWAEIGESSLIGPELVQEKTDKVVLIKEKLKVARDRQKSYVDNRCKPLEFEAGDRVMLKVSPWKGVIRFGKKGKLAPRYVGPFEILERVGHVAYRLRLPEELSGVHDTFHVSNLKKCLADASLHVPLDEIKVDKTLRFVEEPVEIMDHKIMSLKRSRISLVKVHWNSKRGPEFTWEREDYMKSKFDNQSIKRDPLIEIGFVLDFVEFISFTFSDKEIILEIEAGMKRLKSLDQWVNKTKRIRSTSVARSASSVDNGAEIGNVRSEASRGSGIGETQASTKGSGIENARNMYALQQEEKWEKDIIYYNESHDHLTIRALSMVLL